MHDDDKFLLNIARQSIAFSLKEGNQGSIDANKVPRSLLAPGASFVTLIIENKLRGCIGSVKAHRALAQDVAANAYMAAFKDRRFTPLTEQEYPKILIDISILSEPQPIDFHDEDELLGIIRPRVDGLILQENEHRGVFLPTVWQKLPNKKRFLQELKIKAGLGADYWSDDIACWRFSTRVIKEKP